MGPILFLIYMNDFPDNLESPVRLYVDDCILYHPLVSTEDTAVLQRDLTRLSNWEKLWQMKFGIPKCYVLHVSRFHQPSTHEYKLEHCTLKTVNEITYLGITINSKLTWTDHILHITKRANQSLGFLRRNLSAAFQSVKEKAYLTYVHPKLEFASTVWNPYQQKDIQAIEMVQRRAVRFITNTYDRYASITTIISQLQLESLQERRSKACVILVYKINRLVCIQPEPYFNIQVPQITYPQRSRPQHYIPTCFSRTDYLKFSFFYRSIVLWNSLPSNIFTQGPDLEEIKAKLQSININ